MRGLWDNIHAKRKRIKSGSGEKMRKPGSSGAPTSEALKKSQVKADSGAILKRVGVQGFNQPKRTPNHPTKSHVVVVKNPGGGTKTIRFGQQGVTTAGKPKEGESQKQKNRRKSFKARHGKNISKGKTSAAYWANKVKWEDGGVNEPDWSKMNISATSKNPGVDYKKSMEEQDQSEAGQRMQAHTEAQQKKYKEDKSIGSRTQAAMKPLKMLGYIPTPITMGIGAAASAVDTGIDIGRGKDATGGVIETAASVIPGLKHAKKFKDVGKHLIKKGGTKAATSQMKEGGMVYAPKGFHWMKKGDGKYKLMKHAPKKFKQHKGASLKANFTIQKRHK